MSGQRAALVGWHARLEGVTSSVRVPFILSGTQLALPLPPYSTLLGLLSCCAGRPICPSEVRIGMEYRHAGDNVDRTETWCRLSADPGTGRLKANPVTDVGQRGFHAEPVLDLFVVGEEAGRWLSRPVGVPVLGRSQDLMTIRLLEECRLEPASAGVVRGTWLPFSPTAPPGRLFRLTEWFSSSQRGLVRRAVGSLLFTAVEYDAAATVSGDCLYHVEGSEPGSAIYLHEWQRPVE